MIDFCRTFGTTANHSTVQRSITVFEITTTKRRCDVNQLSPVPLPLVTMTFLNLWVLYKSFHNNSHMKFRSCLLSSKLNENVMKFLGLPSAEADWRYKSFLEALWVLKNESLEILRILSISTTTKSPFSRNQVEVFEKKLQRDI